MTTIVSLKCKDGFIIASDMQVTGSGHLKVPVKYNKLNFIQKNIIVGGAGRVSEIQQISQQAIRDLRINLAAADQPVDNVNPKDFIKKFAQLLFTLNLHYRKASFSDFIVAGVDDETGVTCVNISGDGAEIPIQHYYAIGSGSELAMSVLANKYQPDLEIATAASIGLEALATANHLDAFTGDLFELYSVTSQGISTFKPVESTEETK